MQCMTFLLLIVRVIIFPCTQTLLTLLQKKHQKLKHQKEADDEELEMPPQYQGEASLLLSWNSILCH